ncbi:hypothetical protein HHK36_004338 [Tetracentron sinense]|uniref:Sugar phosphate transporter domain-containing protein n=1 Tax=Tetracentron sinense TaxID=13715 RepID=A0A834ZPU7_TETSI|nr:hypothetical protein HHK36_004338 [Tetracentron sinense]
MEESLLCQWSVFRSFLAILQWWGFNVTVIIMNKWIFQKLDFKFPLTVSCIHFICSSVGAYLAIKVFKVKPLIEVDPEDRWRRIFPMSFVFCINIVLGNVSLRYIPVSFMQTIKSFTPATTVVLQWLVWRKYFDWRIWTSLVPIVGGILLTSVTELSFNIFGFCAALFGCLATSTKTILAESLLHGYKFDSPLFNAATLEFDLWLCSYRQELILKCFGYWKASVLFPQELVLHVNSVGNNGPISVVAELWKRILLSSKSALPIVAVLLWIGPGFQQRSLHSRINWLYTHSRVFVQNEFQYALLLILWFFLVLFSINTVYYMAPFATMILAVPALLLEGAGVIAWFYTHDSLCSSLLIIFSSGVLAFCLNFSIFYVIHSTTAVTFNVAGNMKVAVAVMVSWLIFRNPIPALNAVGCGVTLIGCSFYGYVRHKISQQPPGTPRTPRTPRNRMELLPLVNDKLDDKI